MSQAAVASAQPQEFDRVRSLVRNLTQEVGKRVVGQKDTVDCLSAGLLLGGHVLMEGVPGIGKTLLARTLSEVVSLSFSRVQFTPDLMPADILGTHMISNEGGGAPKLTLQKGPVFTNILLADEINRASPKTQSAMLEAMQEKQVSLGNTSYKLPEPYFVVATQNPIDQEGTYPLPEAQLDRFLMKVNLPFPTEADVLAIVARTAHGTEAPVTPVADANTILTAGRVLRQLPVAEEVARFAVRLVFATHPEVKGAPACVARFVKCGASPRAAQSLLAVAKFFAVLNGRLHVALEDIEKAAYPCLRHRVLLNFDAIAEDVGSDELIQQLLHEVKSNWKKKKGK